MSEASPGRAGGRSLRIRAATTLTLLLAVGTVTTLTWRATSSAFSSTTATPSNSFTSGQVGVSDDDSGTALFSTSGLVPGNTASACISVTYTGNVPAAVKLYMASGNYTGTLGSYLTLTIYQGTGGSFAGGCTGFSSTSQLYSGTMAAFASTATDYASGVGAFTPSTNGDHVTYKFTYAVTDDNTAQSLTSTFVFTWESRNT